MGDETVEKRQDMKVLYDYQMFSYQRIGGISRYFAHLYRHVPDERIETSVALLYTQNVYLQGEHFLLQNGVGRLLIGNHFRDANKLWSKVRIRLSDYDILHPTYYNPYLIPDAKGRTLVLTVHDLIHQLYPEYFPGDRRTVEWQRRIIARADHLIAISENTKRDLMEVMKVPEEKITVIHHGLMLGGRRKELSAQERTMVLPENYILFVGDRTRYKNFDGFISEVAVLLKEYDIHLICTGGRAFSSEEWQRIRSLGVADRVSRMTVSDTMLEKLYRHAICFVYPSLYEGFGLPILEAYHVGCPVVLSRASCFPEIAGDAALYFEPGREGCMREAVRTLLDDKARRRTLSEAGRRRLALFSAEKMVERTRELYLRLGATDR